MPDTPYERPRRFTALVNPISGTRHAAGDWDEVTARLRTAGAEVTTIATRSAQHAVEAAGDAARRGDVVVAVGGDGMVRDIATGVHTADGVMAIVPSGRGNDLARTLGIGTDPAELAVLLLEGSVRSIDVLEVGGVIAPGNVYVGVDSHATRLINRLRRLPALLVYRVAGVLAISTWTAPTYTVEIDGRRITTRASTVVISNSGAYGNGLRIVPPAVLDDGHLDVMIVDDVPRRAIIRFLAQAAKGTHVGRPEVRLETGTRVSVAIDREVPVCADGDEIGTVPIEVRLLPAALRVIAPPAPVV
ncbi:YegS/Rv2252/BmrU family lipid kinase [Mumia flava]|uniref:YegS/Rv2252/BmrU family lipid kinase n=1 Tax=Mumia flava TaxID=1348852 RepID=A0A0B2B6J8_9ACTN|nr:diacylglycerol kinase family protein [Mumia flava]PJJ57691.1 YegS/Rv2252/BmrU family lipid kinase [Mumia flava]